MSSRAQSAHQVFKKDDSALIERLIAEKQGLGAQYEFEPNTLEFRANKVGVRGMFTRRALPAGTEFLSVPIKNGSLTVYRAYEEAQELLQKLGPDRYNLSNNFVLASAMYLRYTKADTVESDLLVTESDLVSSYSGLPISSYGSKEVSELISPNDKARLYEAGQQDELIRKMGVKPALFRAMLGYVKSRSWGTYGIIPVLDWLNSSFGQELNCVFQVKEDRLCFQLIKDVEAGAELVWQYNSNNALMTWLNYGFRDVERPTIAFLTLELSDEEQAQFEAFANLRLPWLNKKELFSSNVMDKNTLSFSLQNIAKKPVSSKMRNTIGDCLKQFLYLRVVFRALVLSQDQGGAKIITKDRIEGDAPIYGLDFERQVIQAMIDALKTGLKESHQRAKKFKASAIGRSIVMTPFIEMTKEASIAWIKALTIVKAVCSTEDISERIGIINKALNVKVSAEKQLKPSLLLQLDRSETALASALILRYLTPVSSELEHKGPKLIALNKTITIKKNSG